MILYHVTLFNKPTQEILIPRIPGDTSIGEEVKTNRICLAPSIIKCLRALEIYKYFQEDTLDVKVYKIVVDENDEQLISWEQLYLNGLVDDAALTHEYWYKSKLIPVEYNEYRISECVKKRYIIIPSKEKMRIKEIIETMGVCFDRLEKYNAFQIMNEWLPRQSETFQEQVKEKLKLKIKYMKIKIDSLDNIHTAAKEFLQNMGDGKVFAFYGKMGAGKTTFVKAICEDLGVEDVITSPTFALVNEYTAGNGDPIYHFDFYRIKKIDEVYDMGYEDYFYSGNLCFLEWPELIEDLLPEDCTKVTITVEEDGSRSVEF